MKKKLLKILFAVLFLLFFNEASYSANEFFRSIASGNWNANLTWEMSTNSGSTWIAATLTPTDASGTITVRFPNTVTVTVSVNADQLNIDSGSISINTGIILTLLNGTGTDFTVLKGGSVTGLGTFQTQGTVAMNIRSGSNFIVALKVNTGTATVADLSSPFEAKLFGNVTVDGGATLSSNTSSIYTLFIYGNLTNNGTVLGSGSVKFFGAILINAGSISPTSFSFDSTSTVSGAGTWTGGTVSITGNGNVSLMNNVTFSLSGNLTINTGGDFTANGNTFTFTSGTFNILTGGTVANSGTIRTQNTVTINPRTGSAFNANLNVNSGTTFVSETSSPLNGKLFGNVTVDGGATLSSNTSSIYTLFIYGNLTNNGTVLGLGTVKFFGATLINAGSISPTSFSFDSTSTVSGAGTWTGGTITISSNGNVTLMNNVTFSLSGNLTINTGGDFTANGNTFTFSSGTFNILTGGTVANSGTVKTQNTVSINPRTGSAFNANLNVNSGTTFVSETSAPFNGRLFGNVTVDSGATLSSGGSTSYTLFIFGNITNNGSIIGGGDIEFQSGSHTLQGTGNWTTQAFFLSGSVVTMGSNHQMKNITINSGATFDISNYLIKLTATNPITQNGTFTTTGSKIEYNGTLAQTISTTNIVYGGLRINNLLGTTLPGNISVSDTLSVILGDLDLSGKIITVSSTGYLTETPGNTVKGIGNLTTTRNVGTPTDVNVGGFGAVLTATTNLGSTEIKRGHTVQTGLNGGTSIKRYYDITPANNSGLNASLIFKFDDSELNGKPEPSLKLFKSTNTGSTWIFQGGTVNIVNNTITLLGLTSFSRWSADSSKVSAAIGLIMEGFYNTGTNNLNMTDTVRAYLRNTTTPFVVIDSAVGLLDSLTFKSGLQFTNASTGTYYIQLKHRNSLETWSKNGVNYIQDSTLNYDFTFAANQAFGNNMILKGTKYCLFSGDVSQDGTIDLTDVILINNAASVFSTGYVTTDANGNSIVDLTDVIIAYNNANNFVTRKTPLNP